MAQILDRFSRSLAWLAFHRPWTVIVVAITLAIASSAVSARWLRWNANPDELAAWGSEYREDYLRYVNEFGDIDCIYVVVANSSNARRTERCVDDLTARLREIPDIEGVYSSVGADDQLRVASRAMPIEDLRSLRDASGAFPAILSPDGPGRVLREARGMLTELAARGLLMEEQEQRELGSSALFLLNTLAGAEPASEARQTLAPLLRDDSQKAYLCTANSSLYFIRIMPHKDYSTLDVIARPLAMIREVLDEFRMAYPDLEIGLTGKQVLLADQMAVASRDMTYATILSIVLVWLLFIIALRGFVRPILAVTCLGIGMGWTFGVVTLVIGQLTLISAAFTPILVGIGIEFGVHILVRYQEERRRCHSSLALRRAMLSVSRGNITGALASCAAFLTAVFTRSPGFSQLGFVAGSGVLLCMIAMTLVLPAMIVICDRWFPGSTRSNVFVPVRLPLPRRAMGGRFLVACSLITLVFGVFSFRVGFRDNVLELQPAGLPSVKWEERVLAESGSTLFAAIPLDSVEDVARVVEKARTLPTVGSVHSILDVMAPDSPERIKLRAELACDVTPPGRKESNWSSEHVSSLAKSVLALEPFARVQSPKDADRMKRLAADLLKLGDRLASTNPEIVHQARKDTEQFLDRVRSAITMLLAGDQLVTRDALPESVRAMLMSPGGRMLVMIHPRENVWDFAALDRFVADLQTIHPRVTGFPVIHRSTVNDLKWSFVISSLLSLMVVTVIVWFDFRSWRATALAMTPLIMSMVWTLGWMGVVGIDFNLVNFIAIPIMLGVGVDHGVHILHRLHEDADEQEMGSTSWAVVMTSLTTMFGFGSLMISAHRGAYSLGLLMSVGSMLTLAASLFVLPALVRWVHAKEKTPQSEIALAPQVPLRAA